MLMTTALSLLQLQYLVVIVPNPLGDLVVGLLEFAYDYLEVYRPTRSSAPHIVPGEDLFNRGPPCVCGENPFDHVPPEMLLAVASHLLPTDRTLFAHTHRRAYFLVRGNPRFRNDKQRTAALSLDHRMDFVYAVSQNDVDRALSGTSARLHPANNIADWPHPDVPGANNHVATLQRPAYAIYRYGHVQLALRYTRLATAETSLHDWWHSPLRLRHRWHRRRLLQTVYTDVDIGYKPSPLSVMSVFWPDPSPDRASCTRVKSTPRIVWVPREIKTAAAPGPMGTGGGAHHFLLLQHFPHKDLDHLRCRTASAHLLDAHRVDICPHKFFDCIGKSHPDGQGSCQHCPTDYVWRDGDCFVYRDLGPEQSPTAAAWRSHRPPNEEEPGARARHPARTTNTTRSVTAHHEPGSVIWMYKTL